MVTTIKDETPEESKAIEPKFNPSEKIEKALGDFGQCDYERHWDLIALKFLFTTSVSVFFTKFTQILKYNLDSDSIDIGYITSYMNGLAFAAVFIVKIIRQKFHIERILMIKIALLNLLISVIIACYAPCYTLYNLACIPMVISRSYLNTIWKELYATRKNDALNEINEATGVTAGLTVPLLFGITCNNIGHYAVILYSTIPIGASLYIINKHTSQYEEIEDDSNKNK